MASPENPRAGHYPNAQCSASAAPIYGQPAVPQIHMMQAQGPIYTPPTLIVPSMAAQGYPAVVYPAPAYPQLGMQGVRVWDGGVCGCCDKRDDRCCLTCWFPYTTFGQAMQRTGLGRCVPQAITHFALGIGAFIVLLIIAAASGIGWLIYVGILLMICGWSYGGYWRYQMRRRFNISGGSLIEDVCLHMWCSTCAICQEWRTLEENRVQGGVWQGPAPKATAIVVGQPIEMVTVNSAPQGYR
eukprot:TRINITY_DN2452_c0_g1_i1.p1 TRINITY_DN2452_c0_g1~~TRINITY_DN2452_c0_g1_i1.p1  ORF type:complete len:242 (-),score=15.12 TRINITY_DN2452_c0_g1_i1:380-1105(-)